MPRRVTWSAEEVVQVFETYTALDDIVVFDFETTGLDPYAPGAACVLLQLTYRLAGGPESDPLMTVLMPLHHPESWLYRVDKNLPVEQRGLVQRHLYEVGTWLCNRGVKLVGHHAKFDLKWWAIYSGHPEFARRLASHLVWDTQMAAYLLDENAFNALKVVVPRTFGVEDWSIDLSKEGAALRVPLPLLLKYGALDTEWTYRLLLHQLEQLNPDNYTDGINKYVARRLRTLMQVIGMPCIRTLTEQEIYGWAIDDDLLGRELERLETSAQVSREKLAADGFFDSVDLVTGEAGSGLFKQAIARAVAWGDMKPTRKTKTGNECWDKHVLCEQKDSRFAPAMLALRKDVVAARYMRQWHGKAVDHVIHPTYNPTRIDNDFGKTEGTTTGRLSSTKPNMQQVNYALKQVFRPHRPELVIASLDYSQLELRLAAAVSGSPNMIQAFRDGKDLHRMFAAIITGKPEHAVTKDERQKAKACNFGFLYGQHAKGFVRYANDVYGVEISKEEAEEVRDMWFATWQGIAEWHLSSKKHAQTHGAIWSPMGRIRHLPNIRTGSWKERSDDERKAINAPIQSLGSDLLQLATGMITGSVPWLTEPMVPQALVLGTVHDEIDAEVPLEGYRPIVDEMEKIMTTDILDVLEEHFDWQLDVPLAVGVTVGTKWGAADVYDSELAAA